MEEATWKNAAGSVRARATNMLTRGRWVVSMVSTRTFVGPKGGVLRDKLC